jgi:hypothetical protein
MNASSQPRSSAIERGDRRYLDQLHSHALGEQEALLAKLEALTVRSGMWLFGQHRVVRSLPLNSPGSSHARCVDLDAKVRFEDFPPRMLRHLLKRRVGEAQR